MASQLTLSQVIQYFAGLAAQDRRINSFGFGPISDISSGPYFNINTTGKTYNLQTSPVVYPLMWVEPDTSTLRTDSILLKHKLHFVDLVNKDSSNRLDVSSDALQAALEIKAFIQKDFFYEIFPDSEAELTPVFEKYDDEVAGYIMQCDLQMDWLADVCNIPGLYPSGATFQAGPGYYSVALNGYLPLAGGTLTGPLYGTCGYFNCFSATSLSGGNIYSGDTNISELFLSIYTALGSATTLVQNGLNTYTGGTFLNPTVNISGGSFDHMYVSGDTTTNGLSATTFSVFTGGTPFLKTTNSGEFNFAGGNGTGSQIAIHQDSAFHSRILDVYNNSYSKSLLVLSDNGSAGQVNVGNNTFLIDTYLQTTSIGGTPSAFTRLGILGNAINQDIIGIRPFMGNGTFAVNTTSQNDPYVYLQASAGTTTTIAIYSSGSTYFNGGNVGFNSTLPAQDAIHIYNGTIRINDTGNTYGTGKIAVSDVNGSISFSSTTALGANSTYVQNGLNTYTGGTASLPTVNISAATLTSLSATTISGGTLYSGSTNLYSIFSPLGATSVFLQNGTNTYTGGTASLPSVNISGGTFQDITASGNTILQGLTATTITANTISATTVTSPTIYGSALSGGTLRIDSTSNSSKGAINFGSSGNSNSYYFNVGTGSSVVTIRERIGATSQAAFYLGVPAGTESANNFTLGWDGSLRVNAQATTSQISLLAGNTGLLVLTPGSTVANPFFDFQARTRTSLTTATNVPVFNINPSTQTWATGALSNQYFAWFRPQTIAFAGASTASTLANVAIDHSKIGALATATTATALYIPPGTYSATTTSYGVLIDTVTGAATNYSLGISGDSITTGNTLQYGGFSSFTNSVSGVSFLHTSGGTPVLNVNTSNGRVGINNPAGTNTVDVGGNVNVRSSISASLIGGYYVNNNIVLQQGPAGYSSNAIVFGNPSVASALSVFTSAPFGIATSGSTLRNQFTISQSSSCYGTVASTSGSSILTGTSTSFLTQFNPGDTIRIGGGLNYIVSAITSDTLMTTTVVVTATTSPTTFTFPSGAGERFTVGANGNVKSTSNSVSGFTIYNRTGTTPVFAVDTQNFVTTATTLAITGRMYNVVSPAIINSATTIDWSTDNIFDYTLTAATTFTFSNIVPGQTTIVAVRQPFTGSTGYNYSFTGSTVYWPASSTPAGTTTTGKTDIYTFVSLSANSVYGTALLNY